MSAKGNIGVTSENIFPIIKKFLYSDHEIFLRELVSNAVDATQKLKTLASVGEFKGEMGDLTVRVKFDDSTITISDRGIGMTAEEIDKYINQIAFSGAEEFVKKYKNDAAAIIGHFGLGFYSSFMVSKKVEIVTKSYKEGAVAMKWSCDGTPEYTMEETDKADRGTDIILYIDDENKDFLNKEKINGLLTKYCRFLPVEIAFGKKQEWKDGKYVDTDQDNIINDTKPAWVRKPSELKDEDYKKFYQDLYPMSEEPLFWIHLNVDYPFNLTGILYFPRIKSNLDLHRNKIQLYCNQVFVTDSVENIVPDFLTLLHGVIDSPDIPLDYKTGVFKSLTNNISFYRKNFAQLNALVGKLFINYPHDRGVKELYVSHLIKSGQIGSALDICKQIAGSGDATADDYINIIDMENFLERPDSAVLYTDRGIARFPENLQIRMRRGYTLERQNRHARLAAQRPVGDDWQRTVPVWRQKGVLPFVPQGPRLFPRQRDGAQQLRLLPERG